ncbi:MAG TPA: hypothetical protein PKZ16_02795 [bacterium]|nr:hypothetical protein [bacterium]HPL95236.1 hypothetical protein [bacterium]
MSKFFSLCKKNRHHWPSNNHNQQNMRSRKSGLNFYNYGSFFLILAIIFSGVFYLLNITSFATDGFKITAGEEKYKVLTLTNENLQANLRSLVDLAAVKNKAQALGLSSTLDINYVATINNGVALNH